MTSNAILQCYILLLFHKIVILSEMYAAEKLLPNTLQKHKVCVQIMKINEAGSSLMPALSSVFGRVTRGITDPF